MISPSGLLYTRNKVGPRTNPCRTLYFITSWLERELFTLTDVVRTSSYDEMIQCLPVSVSARYLVSHISDIQRHPNNYAKLTVCLDIHLDEEQI